MDPNAAVEALVEALESRDTEQAKELIGYLVAWMNRKGFAPKLEFHTLEFLLKELSDRL